MPFDPQKPFVTSGVRIGTPALTTRGMREEEMRTIGGWIHEIVTHIGDEAAIGRVRTAVGELSSQFPLYADATAEIAGSTPSRAL